MIAILEIFIRLRPELVHLVTPKPVLYGSLAARFARVPGLIVAISGLGIIFSGEHFRTRMLRQMVLRLYRFAFRHPNLRIIFQNTADRDLLLASRAILPSQVVTIRGSGVCLSHYRLTEEPASAPTATFAARLLASKGVREFVQAARILRERGVQAQFVVAGTPDPGNPETISDSEVEFWTAEGIVNVLGYCSDIPGLFSRSHLVVLPSYYGEGLPKVLIEAAACGRAVVTTDMPGCREAIVPAVTGLLVPPKDPVALADAIHRLIADPRRRREMGRAGRVLAERAFDVSAVVAAHLRIYDELVAAATG